MYTKHDIEAGQIGLVVLLIMAVLMTMGLGIVSQSIVETKIARQETESSQTFNVAEQGVEEALGRQLSQVPGSFPIQVTPNEDYTTNVVADAKVTYSKTVFQGHSAQIALTPTTDNKIKISWNAGSGCTGANRTASVIVTLVSENGTNTRRLAYRPSDCAARDINFADVSLNANRYQTAEIGTLGFKIARIKVLYSTADIQVSGVALPVQQHVITSTATRESGESRTIQASKTNPATSSIFDYVLFSGTDITQTP